MVRDMGFDARWRRRDFFFLGGDLITNGVVGKKRK